MLANFTKPLPTKPSLLGLGEVTTFFHEFGHIMHHLLDKSKYQNLSSGDIEWDFVEAPSQMFENFVYNNNVIREISGHYKTGEKISSLFQFIKVKKEDKDHFYNSFKKMDHENIFKMIYKRQTNPEKSS